MEARDSDLLSLPVEVIIRIISLLHVSDLVLGIRQTCRCLQRASRISDLWKNVKVSNIRVPTTEIPRTFNRSKKFYFHLLHQECILPAKLYDDGEAQGQPLQVRTVVTSLEEKGEVWPDCSVAGMMIVYPNLQKLTLKGTIYRMDFLSRYTHLLYLDIHVEAELVERFFEFLKHLTLLQTLKFKMIDSRNVPSSVDVEKPVVGYFLTGPKLRRLHLNYDVSEDVVRAAVDHCSELKELLVWKSHLTSETLQTVCDKPSTLSCLRLLYQVRLDKRCLDMISQAFPYLETLELSIDAEISNQDMRLLLRACSLLTDIRLTLFPTETLTASEGESDSTTDDSDSTNGADPENGARAGDSNTDANTGASGGSAGSDAETPERHIRFGHFLNELENGQNEGRLQRLDLVNFHCCGTALGQNQPNLRVVKLHWCWVDDENVSTVANNCPQLKTVVFSHCRTVSSRAVTALINSLPWLQMLRCDSLVETHYDPAEDEQPVGNGNSPGTLRELKENARYSRLRFLHIRSSNLHFTAEGMMTFGTFCPNLLCLFIDQDDLLEDDCFKEILRSCVGLQELRIRSPARKTTQKARLSNDSLEHILNYGRELRTLQLPYCPLMTAYCMARMIVQSPCLVEFFFGIFRDKNRATLPIRRFAESSALRDHLSTLLRHPTGAENAVQYVSSVGSGPYSADYDACYIRRKCAHKKENRLEMCRC